MFGAGATSESNDGTGARGAEALVLHLVACGYPRCDPPLIQPAKIFLDQSGEDIRGRLYLTSDPSGAELCLRPEFTIPVCRAYLDSPEAGKPAFFSYLGPVFRYRPDGPAQSLQAGLENFGRDDREAADADVLACALEAAAAAGAGSLVVRMGDAGLIRSFMEALALPSVWRRRIAQGLAQGRTPDQLFAPPANDRNGDDHSGVLAALDGVDKIGARALVEDLLSIAGITSVGGRTAGEIADRFLEQAALRGGPGVPAEKRAVFERFLALSGDPDTAAADLRTLASDAGLALDETLDAFDLRLHFLAARGVDLARARFAAGFARRLDYYTGFVFEASPEGAAPGAQPLIGGGRYDRLLRSLGGKADVPAVGAAIFVDRLANAGASA